MSYEYEKIEIIGTEIYELNKGILLKERLLYGEMSELILDSVKPLKEYRKNTVHDESVLLILASRLFNDAEGAKYLLLRGLPSQAQPVIRDIIECTMLFRLFLKKPELAKRWLMESIEYEPGTVNAMLLEMSVDAREYAFYGELSHMGHANLLASMANVQEKKVKEGVLLTVHFGSSRTPETMFFVQQSFFTLFFLLYIALIEPLAECYSLYPDTDNDATWAKKVNGLFPKLEEYGAEINATNTELEAQVDQRIYRLIEKKMRLKNFRKRLSGSGD